MRKLHKLRDLRSYKPLSTTHKDFIIGVDGGKDSFYLRRGNPPTIKDTITAEQKTWWYGITPTGSANVSKAKHSVREVFQAMLDEGWWKNGTGSGNTSLICKEDIPRLYDLYVSHRR